MRVAGAVVAAVHRRMAELIEPGITTAELDAEARQIIADAGGTPSFLGYHGYPAAICASVNEEVVHGIPSERSLKSGDIISIDVGAYIDGFHGDAAATYPVGEIDSDVQELIDAAKRAFEAGVGVAVVGNRIGDVSAAIQASIEQSGFGIVRGYGGHGVGRRMHEDPSVLNYGTGGTGARLQPGMTLAIEPMLTLGDHEVQELEDGWTVVTVDGKPAAHYEHTVLITDGKPELLTQFVEEMVY
ncbi:MAG: type I methionyl aminopeptidase [Thermomicrobiales bacterium]